MPASLPPPTWPAIALTFLATVWLEDESPKRRKVFFRRLRAAVDRYRAGERPLRLERPPEDMAAADAEVEKMLVYVEAWMARAKKHLET